MCRNVKGKLKVRCTFLLLLGHIDKIRENWAMPMECLARIGIFCQGSINSVLIMPTRSLDKTILLSSLLPRTVIKWWSHGNLFCLAKNRTKGSVESLMEYSRTIDVEVFISDQVFKEWGSLGGKLTKFSYFWSDWAHISSLKSYLKCFQSL